MFDLQEKICKCGNTIVRLEGQLCNATPGTTEYNEIADNLELVRDSLRTFKYKLRGEEVNQANTLN